MTKTIKQELQEIAKACINSEEFTERAKSYLKREKHINQPLMDDSELREIYREVDSQREKEKAWETFDSVIKPSLKLRPDCKGLWYETWIDLEETWLDKWFASFRFMPTKEIVEVCAKYLNERERFYDSPNYTDMLNDMIKNVKFEEK